MSCVKYGAPSQSCRWRAIMSILLLIVCASLRTASAAEATVQGLPNTTLATSVTYDTYNNVSAYGVVAQPVSSSQLHNSTTVGSTVQFRWEDFFKPGEDLINLIVVFKQHKHLEKFSPLCSRAMLLRKQQRLQRLHSLIDRRSHALDASATSSNDTSPQSSSRNLGTACNALEGSCRHIFKSAIAGFAGKFTRQQFVALQHCAGSDVIDYIEKDAQVNKLEKGTYRGWWRNRPPPGTTLQHLLSMQLQQRQQHQLKTSDSGSYSSSDVGDMAPSNPEIQAFDDGEASAGTVGDNDSSRNNTNNTSDDGNAPAAQLIRPIRPGQLWQGMLAEVGLSAQQELASGVPSITVKAADGPSDSSAAVSSNASLLPAITAAEGEGGGSSAFDEDRGDLLRLDGEGLGGSSGVSVEGESQVTKNQDPGLPVDAAAIANPEIIALSPHDGTKARSTASDQQPLPQQQINTANAQPGVKIQKLVTALWNLDRIDQRNLPLDGTFAYGTAANPGTGKGVTIYTVDSGIRTSHQEFQPWGGGDSRARLGPDFVDDDDAADDCDGHGTHVSSTAAGRSVGVAKDASVVGVRVLDCDGAGSISNVVAALDWVAQNAVKPAVASMSLGVPSGIWSRSLETAVKSLVAKGVPVVVAAGNSAKDSCQVAPARVPEAVTVAASNLPNKFQRTTSDDTENLYRWSNTGACIDVFAPGVDIYGACGGPSRCEAVTDSAYTWASGTSMAAPHVTGLIAVYLEAHPKATPAEVHDALLAASTAGVLQSELMLLETPNRMVYSAGLNEQQVSVAATGGPGNGS